MRAVLGDVGVHCQNRGGHGLRGGGRGNWDGRGVYCLNGDLGVFRYHSRRVCPMPIVVL